ncbi:OpgC domain-containing protein [Marinimicrococcus flavescens]|uniref:OpgC domain-containing protein n=1 Tax=Marinimicrococcus flavescens TaxID=3031815 RepID=A0AAP3UYF7_9PROT|nr:OpgC domain-containing protein [Marinimicrococcus flavescens]
MLSHLEFSGFYFIKNLHFGELGFVQSAQGFIFLSGLLVGLIFMKRHERAGAAQVRRRLWGRALELYGWHIGILLAILALSRLMPDSWFVWNRWLGRLYDGGDVYVAAAAALLYQPSYMDILPQYMAYLLVSPLLIQLIATGRAAWVMAGSAACWLAVQLGAHMPLVALLDGLWMGGATLQPRAAFNPLAWQVIFVSGLVAGALAARGELQPRRLLDPQRPMLFHLAVGGLVFFLAWRMAITTGLIAPEVLERFQAYENRVEFGLVFLLNFVALGYAVAWLLVAGQRSASYGLRVGATLLNRLLSHPFLVLIGGYSLQVFAWHVVAVYLLRLVDWHVGPLAEPLNSLLAVAAIASLALPARWLASRAPTRLADAPQPSRS